MRGQDIVALLAYEAKRRPEIQQAMDNIDSLSDQDIENLVVPLPWYRQALRSMKARKEFEKLLNYPTKITHTPDSYGRIAIYKGENTDLKHRASSLEIVTGFPVWFPDSGGVWVDTVWFPVIPSALQNIPTGDHITFLGYKDALRSRRQAMI